MRVVVLLATALVFLSCNAAAQTDGIGLFSDPSYNSCELVDAGGGLVTVYVVHSTTGGATGSQFMVAADAGAALTYVSETPAFDLVIGDVQSGISLGYGECKYADILVVAVKYIASGSSRACSKLSVVPDPKSLTGTIEVVTCGMSKGEGIGSTLVINPDGTCECGPSTELTSWGRIKAKYRE